MKINISRSELSQSAVILLLIFNIVIGSISNYSASSLILKIISSALLLIALYIQFYTNDIPVFQFLKSKQVLKLFYVLLIIIIYLSATLLYTSNPGYGLYKIINIILNAGPNVLAAYILLSANKLFILNKIITFSTIIIVSLLILILLLQPFDHSTIYKFSPGRWSHSIIGRISSFITLIILLFTLIQTESKKIIFYSLVYGAGVYLTYLTGLRSAFIGLIILSIIALALKYFYVLRTVSTIHASESEDHTFDSHIHSESTLTPAGRYFSSISIILILSIVFLVIMFAPSEFQSGKRFENLTKVENLDFGKDDAILVRLMSYELSLDIIKEHLLLGIGFGGFNGYNNIEWTRTGKYPHNIILELLSELGIVGLLFFSAILFITIKAIVKSGLPTIAIYFILIPLLFSIWLAMWAKDLSTQSFLWLFLAAYGAKGKELNE